MKILEPITIICDIDGCLLEHVETQSAQMTKYPEALPGVLDKLNQWERKGYRIILLTGRRESTRKITEEQLAKCGIYYDQLVMGVCRGTRVLINDLKPSDPEIRVAVGIELERNKGIGTINEI